MDDHSSDFAALVERFLGAIETGNLATKSGLSEVARHLAALYAAAMDFPNLKPEGADDVRDQWDERHAGLRASVAKLPVGFYWEVFDPLEAMGADKPPECSVGDLADDLLDVSRDLSAGLDMWNAEYSGDAVEHWRLLFPHWGQHATGALRTIHAYLTKYDA